MTRKQPQKCVFLGVGKIVRPLEKIREQVTVMPTVTGLSLRRGLQVLSPYNIKVRVHGNGRIIAQYPLPGASLAGVDECILTLESDGVQP